MAGTRLSPSPPYRGRAPYLPDGTTGSPHLLLDVPFKQLDWPNPVLQNWKIVQRIPLGSSGRPSFSVVPTAQRDWPNPVLQPWSLVRRSLASRGRPTISVIPTSQTDWPLPTRKRWVPTMRITRPGTSPRTAQAPVTLPFFSQDWPNPQRARFPIENRSWIGILSYLGFETPAFFQPSPPNPLRHVWRQTGWIHTLNPPIPEVFPALEHLWPNPLRPRRHPDWIATLTPPPPEVLSYGNVTWPPLPIRTLPETGSVVSQIPSRIILPIVPPIRQSIWPPPLRRRLEPGWIQFQMPPLPEVLSAHRTTLPSRVDLRRGWRLIETGWIQTQIPPTAPGVPPIRPPMANPIVRAFPTELRSWLGILAYLDFGNAQQYAIDFDDAVQLSDAVQIVHTSAPIITIPGTGWLNPPRLDAILWTPTFGTCACGLGHVGPEGCNAALGRDLGDAVILSDTLDVSYIPVETPVNPDIVTNGVVICEGFEDNGTITDLWDQVGYEYVTTFRGGNTGGRCVRTTATAGTPTEHRGGFPLQTGTSHDNYISVYWMFDNLSLLNFTIARQDNIVGYRNADLTQPFAVGIQHTYSSPLAIPPHVNTTRFYARAGSATIVYGTSAPIQGQPYRIEVQTHSEGAAPHNLVSLVARFYLGDALTPVDTITVPLTDIGSAAAVVSEFVWGNGNAGGGINTVRYWFDDLLVRTEPFSGPYGIYLAKPLADFSTELAVVGGTGTHASAVNEIPGNDDADTSYVWSALAGQKDLYTLQWGSPNAPPAGSLVKASNVLFASRRTTSAGNWTAIMRIFGTNTFAAVPSIGTAYTWNKSPYRDAAIINWSSVTKEDAETFQIGIQQGGGDAETRCTAIYANFALAY